MSLSTMFNLAGRIALVTGGGTGIGLHIARGLATHGAKVYICGRRKEVLSKIASEWTDPGQGGSINALQLDVTSRDSIRAAQAQIEETDGKLHFLVNNAGQVGPVSKFLKDPAAPERKDPGTMGHALFENESFESWAELYSANTISVFFVSTAFLGLLEKGSKDNAGWTSSIVNITSVSGIVKIAQCHFAYNSAKAAASHLTKLLATEFALKGSTVRVNSIAPGVYASEMTMPLVDTPEKTQMIAQSLIPVPSGRGGTEEEMAGSAVYLASRAGGYVNGHELVVDGGYIAVNPSTA